MIKPARPVSTYWALTQELDDLTLATSIVMQQGRASAHAIACMSPETKYKLVEMPELSSMAAARTPIFVAGISIHI